MRPRIRSKRGLISGVAAEKRPGVGSVLLVPRSYFAQSARSRTGLTTGRASFYLVTKNPLHSKADAFRLATFPLLVVALLWRRIGALPNGRLGLLGHARTSVTRPSVLPSGL
jgi:hypothetical protein